MSRVKIKEFKKITGDKDINSMFEEMFGIQDADPEIIIPKLVNVRNTIRHLCKVFEQFSTFNPIRNDFPDVVASLDEIKNYSAEIREKLLIEGNLEEVEETYEKLSKKEVNELYKKLKESSYVKGLIIMCNKLDKYKLNFNDPTAIKENFVNQEPGLTFNIFDFTSLDLKLLWNSDKITFTIKKYILTVLASLHKHSFVLYNIVTSPDVDIEKFTSVLITSLAEIKKHPRLSRCHKAFTRIEQSIELLKDRFSDYYKETIASQNPSSLLTSFIVDVSQQGGTDLRLAREFKEIVNFISEASEKAGKNKDPNIKKVFEYLNTNISLMDNRLKEQEGNK
jgi:hypothetical protein